MKSAATSAVLTGLPTDDTDIFDIFDKPQADGPVAPPLWSLPALAQFAIPGVSAPVPTTAFSHDLSVAATTTSVPSGALQGVAAPAGSGLVIKATIEAGAPAGFANAVNDAILYFEHTFTNNVTINIDFKFGNAGGNIAQSSTSIGLYSYASVIAALTSHDSAIVVDAGLVLPAADPFPGGSNYAIATPDDELWLTNAQATSLGLSTVDSGTHSGDDATITLNADDAFTFDSTQLGAAGVFEATQVL